MKELSSFKSAAEALKDVLPADYQAGRIQTYDQLAQMRCDVYNDSEGKNKEFGCEKCKHRGYFMRLDEDGFDIKVECECLKMIHAAEKLEQFGIAPEKLRQYTFDSYEMHDDFCERALAESKKYAADNTTSWLFMSGQNGSGKTHLCISVCRELLVRGYDVQYLIWPDFEKRFVASRFKEEAYTNLLRMVREPQVLYIDDLLKTPMQNNTHVQPSAQELRDTFEIINQRYYSGKRTIITTEWMSDELYRMDAALGGRIDEMSRNCKIQIEFKEGRDYRKKKGGRSNAVK